MSNWRPPHHQWSSAYAPDSAPLMTLAEFDELEEGAEITVYWSGGNGPHQYRLHHEYGNHYALTRDEFESGRFQRDAISFVGAEPPRTVVWKGWADDHKAGESTKAGSV